MLKRGWVFAIAVVVSFSILTLSLNREDFTLRRMKQPGYISQVEDALREIGFSGSLVSLVRFNNLIKDIGERASREEKQELMTYLIGKASDDREPHPIRNTAKHGLVTLFPYLDSQDRSGILSYFKGEYLRFQKESVWAGNTKNMEGCLEILQKLISKMNDEEIKSLGKNILVHLAEYSLGVEYDGIIVMDIMGIPVVSRVMKHLESSEQAKILTTIRDNFSLGLNRDESYPQVSAEIAYLIVYNLPHFDKKAIEIAYQITLEMLLTPEARLSGIEIARAILDYLPQEKRQHLKGLLEIYEISPTP